MAARSRCDILVNCAGLWAKRVGNMAGVPLAAGVVEHQYFLTEKTLKLDPDLTTLRDPDNNFYLKPDTGSFAIGGWEDGSKGCWRGQPPLDFGRELFAPNMERLELFALPAAERLPVLNEIGIQTVINGPIPVSLDGEPIMGLAPELDNFYVACGFTAGIAGSGGGGLALSNMILHGDAGMDLWPFDVRRFGAVQAQGRYLEERAIEAYGAYYKVHLPGEETQAGRGLRRSPLHGTLLAKGAVFGSKSGWERPNWFALAGGRSVELGELRGQAGLVRGGRRGGPRHPRTRRAHRPDLVLEVRDFRPRRFRRLAGDRRQRSVGSARQGRLHPALQREGRHRGGRHHRPCRPRPLPARHRLGLRRP